MSSLLTRNLQLKRHGKALLEPLNWRVEPGQFWLLAGANGCGKSTLLESLAGLHREYSGEILLAGKPLAGWRSRARARQVSWLPQTDEATPDCLVHEALHMGRFPWGEQNPAWQQKVVTALQLQELLARPLPQLSGGQRRAVELATCLIQDTPFLLLDEPLNQFDPAFRWRVLDFLRQQSDKAIIMASHDLMLAPRFVTHALFVYPDGHSRQGVIADMMKRDHLSALLDWPNTEAVDRLWKNANP